MMFKQKTLNRTLFHIVLLTTVIGFFASFISTYCWYEYQNFVDMSYSGTAVSRNASITLGLISDVRIPDLASTLKEDTESLSPRYVYWTSEGSPLESSTIKIYEKALGYATNKMGATSSLEFKEGSTFSLKTLPYYLESTDLNEAKKSEYSFLNLAIKAGGINKNVYLSNSSVKCGLDVREAVRFYFLDPNSNEANYNGYIYNPSSETSGSHAVGGLLNLNNDDIYDFKNGLDREKIYGVVNSVTYDGSTYDGSKDVPSKDITTFKANHQKGLLIPTIDAKQANYLGKNDFLNKKTVCTTKSNGIAELQTYVYIEGWDKSCIRTTDGCYYSVSLDLTTM